MKRRNSVSRIFISLLAPIIFISLAINFWWIRENTSIQNYSSANYLFFSIHYFYTLQDVLEDPSIGLKERIFQLFQVFSGALKYVVEVWPHFIYSVTSIFYLVFGKSLFSAKLSIWPFILILLFSTFKLGKFVSNRLGAMLAVYLLFMYPLIFETSRQYGVYLPLSSMVALSFWWLLRTEMFKKLKYSILLGIGIGIGMLIRAQILFFLCIPLLFEMVKGLKESKTNRKEVVRNILLFFLIAFLIASLWWAKHIKFAWHYLKMYILDPYLWRLEGATGEERFSLSAVSWPIRNLFFNSMGIVFSVLFLFGLGKAIKRNLAKKYILLSWCLIPVFFYSLAVANKYEGYLMPILPAVAILTGWWVSSLQDQKHKVMVLSLIIVYSLFQFSYLSFDWKWLNKGEKRRIKLIGGTSWGDIRREQDFKIDELVEILRKYSGADEKINLVTVSLSKFRPRELELLYWLRLRDRKIYGLDFVQMFEEVYHNMESMNFVIFKIPESAGLTNWPEEKRLVQLLKEALRPIYYINRTQYPLWNKLMAKFSVQNKRYELIQLVPSQWNYYWLIFKRKYER